MLRLVTPRLAWQGEGDRQRAEIERALAGKEFLWVDLEAPGEEEVRLLREVFRFHPLAVEDCLSGLQRPKLDDYGAYLFLVLYAVGAPAPDGRLHVSQFDVFIAPAFLVTVHLESLTFPDEIFRQYGRDLTLPTRGPAFLLYRLLSRLVDGYFPVLDDIEERLAAVEQEVFLEPDRRWVPEIFALHRRILRVRRTLGPQRDAVAQLAQRVEVLLRNEARTYLMDVYDHLLRLVETTDGYRDLAAAVLEAHLSATSNRLNEIMKVLTVITTIMMPLSVIAGIYGMNFRHMPELYSPYGYPAVLGAMAAVAAGMLWYFRRKGWF
ncbi:MAG: magnesium/cobalt transporter CorA [Bacillota bacterium]